MRRRIAAVVLAALLWTGLFSVCAAAEETGTAGVDIQWTLDDGGTLIISGSGYMSNFTWDGFAPWCAFADYVRYAVVCSGVKSVGDYAFACCPNLISCSLPEGLEYIGVQAFVNCTSLTSLAVPSTVATVGTYAFSNCTALRSVQFLGNAPALGENCFSGVTCACWGNCMYSGWETTSAQQYGGQLNWSVHSLLPETVLAEATCTETGSAKSVCAVCGAEVYRVIPAMGHKVEKVKAVEESCTSDGNPEYWKCSVCGGLFSDRGCGKALRPEDIVIPSGHKPVTDPGVAATLETEGLSEGSHCGRCGEILQEQEVIPALGYTAVFNDLTVGTVISVNGAEYAVGPGGTVPLPNADCALAQVFSYNMGGSVYSDARYPTGSQTYLLNYEGDGIYSVIRCAELDNLLSYAGVAMRTAGDKGLRLITSIPEEKRSLLTSCGIQGFTLREYGTVAGFRSAFPGDNLTLDSPGAVHSAVYIRGGVDSLYGRSGSRLLFSNDFTGFSNEQCGESYVMRPYMLLDTPSGGTAVLYGGIVARTAGYCAWQNRNDYPVGSAPYRYIWSIIHMVYGSIYDAEYVA